jgi:hypothetical protein
MGAMKVFLLLAMGICYTFGEEFCVVADCKETGCIINKDVFSIPHGHRGDVGMIAGIVSGIVCGIILLGGAFITAEVIALYQDGAQQPKQ